MQLLYDYRSGEQQFICIYFHFQDIQIEKLVSHKQDCSLVLAFMFNKTSTRGKH